MRKHPGNRGFLGCLHLLHIQQSVVAGNKDGQVYIHQQVPLLFYLHYGCKNNPTEKEYY